MQEVKLIILLKSLNKDEFRRLGKFLNSPFYNYSNPPILLYDALKKHYPTFDSPKLTQQNIWNKVYPREAFQTNKFWQLASKLTRLVEQFLIAMELEKRPREKQKLLIQALAPRNKKLLLKAINVVEEEIEEKKKASLTVYKEDFLHQLSLSNFHGIFNTTEAIHYEEKFLGALELYYLNQKLKTAINLKSVEKHRNKNYSFHLMNEIMQLTDEDAFSKYPHPKFFAKLFQLVNGGDVTLYLQVKKMFFNIIETFNREDKKFVFHQLMNFTSFQVNSGNKEFKKENFQLYQEGLKQNILVENGKISFRTYTNIISQGVSLKEFEWTEKFMNDYENLLPEASRQDGITMGKGFYLFFKGDFFGTIELLNHYQFKQSVDRLRGKGLVIRSCFEIFFNDKTYFEFFNSYSKSFEKYLGRDDIESGERVEFYLTFVKTIRILGKLINENRFNVKSRKKLIDRLSNEKMVLKPWLLEKIESI